MNFVSVIDSCSFSADMCYWHIYLWVLSVWFWIWVLKMASLVFLKIFIQWFMFFCGWYMLLTTVNLWGLSEFHSHYRFMFLFYWHMLNLWVLSEFYFSTLYISFWCLVHCLILYKYVALLCWFMFLFMLFTLVNLWDFIPVIHSCLCC